VRALITGSSGFVGRHLAAHLAASGDEVTAVDREVDVTDEVSLRAVVAASRPEVVYHLAALTHVGESWEKPAEYTRVNVVGTQCVLDAVAALRPAAVTIVVSSSEVYGVTRVEDQPLVESFRLAPANPYSASKVEAERVARDAVRERGQLVVIARPFNHVGPGQSTGFVVPALVQRLLDARERGEDSVAVGDLSTRRDFLDVRDVVRAYRMLAFAGVAGEAYNVASGHDVAIAEVAEQLVDRVAPGTRLVVDPALLRPIEVPVARGSHEKLTRATGWTPTIPLATSLDDVVADLIVRRGAHE
jgi:GDP-4-dehydro-6-deoxy-D-mannose reductase